MSFSGLLELGGSMMSGPDSAAYWEALGESTLNAMIGAAFGKAGGAVNLAVFGLLGIGGSNSSDAYFDKIESQLAAIQQQLTALQASVSEVLTGIARINQAVTQNAIEQKIDSFNLSAATIKENFNSYGNAITNLTSADDKMRRSASNDLYELFKFLNLQQIDEAMKITQGLYLPSEVEGKGLIAFQLDEVTDGLALLKREQFAFTPASGSRGDVPTNNGLFLAAPFMDASHKAADQVLKTEVPDTFKAFITSQIQGLTLLSIGWRGTAQDKKVNDQIMAIAAVSAAMTAFEGQVLSAVDAAVAASLHGFVLSPKEQDNFGGEGVAWPLSPDWTTWDTVKRKDGMLPRAVLHPWNYGSRNSAMFWYEADSDQLHAQLHPNVQIPHYGPIPNELTFIRNLKPPVPTS
jgi:hypothetical protein